MKEYTLNNIATEKLTFETVLLEDINILLHSKLLSYELKRFLLTDVDNLYDLALDIYLCISNKETKYLSQWKEQLWNYKDLDKRKEHRAWVANLIKNYTKALARKLKRKYNTTNEDIEMALYKEYGNLSVLDKKQYMSILDRAARGPLDLDIIKWKLNTLSCQTLLVKHEISKATLYRHLNVFKGRCVAIAKTDGLIK